MGNFVLAGWDGGWKNGMVEWWKIGMNDIFVRINKFQIINDK